MKNNFIVLDVETGGLEADKNPITQFAATVLEPVRLKELSRIDFYIKPYSEKYILTKEAIQHTQQSLKDINAGMDYKKACGEMIQFFRAANESGRDTTMPIVVGHNVGFDMLMLEHLFMITNKTLYDLVQKVPFDTMNELKVMEAGALRKDEVSRNTLTAACSRFGIKLKNAHGAPADVQATVELFKKIVSIKRTAYLNLTGEASPHNSTESETTETTPRRRARDGFKFEF